MLLNDADSICIGSTTVDKVFLDGVMVWPSVVGITISLNRNYVYSNATVSTLVGYLSTEGGTPPYTYTLEL